MFRYVVMYWCEGDGKAGVYAHRLVEKWRIPVVMTRSGLTVLCTEGAGASRPLLIYGKYEAGAILGQIFHRGRRSQVIDAEQEELILSTRGRCLVSGCWGNYVAFVLRSDGLTVLRAPASTLPCLHFEARGLHVFLSRAEDAAALDEFTFTLDGRRLVRSLIGPLSSSATSVLEMNEVLPGFAAEVGPAGYTERCYWDPIQIASEHEEDGVEFDIAAIRLRETTAAVVEAWSRATPRIVLALSGGLDSSIVAGCLCQAKPRPEVTCLSYYVEEGADSDERQYSRTVAKAAGYESIESRHPQDIDLRTALHGIRSENSPGLRIPAIDRIEPNTARELGAMATYRGSGGDEIACRHHLPLYVSDYLRARGLRREVLPLLMHAAAMEGETFWRILVRVVKDAIFTRSRDMAERFLDEQGGVRESLLNVDVMEAALNEPRFESPYEDAMKRCPPGRAWQIGLIAGPRPYYLPSTREGDPVMVAPLLSQPLIEAVLRIPTWFQMKGRKERALSRAAFEGMVPREVLERRWKGGGEQYAWRLLHRNLPFIRELLLDGRLVREGLVDRRRLEIALSGRMVAGVRASVPMFDLIGAEAWLQAWGDRALVRI